MLRKVVTEEEGTAKLADVHGYYVGGKQELLKIIKIKKDFKYIYIDVSIT